MKTLFKNTIFVLSCVTASSAFAVDPHWTYDEQKEWGEITGKDVTAKPPYPYAECGLGQKQSPVDLGKAKVVSSTNLLQPKYKKESLSISNNGHTVKVNTTSSSLLIGSEKYDLLQYHIHAPSEHVVNGKTYPIEIHFVHGTPDGKLAVIGVFAQEGKENKEFEQILYYAPSEPDSSGNPMMQFINPDNLLPLNRKSFYLYAGSLTTPPCTEGVNWYVMKTPIQLSKDQISRFKNFYADNARLNQPLNGRQVLNK